MATCSITGTVVDPSGTPISGLPVYFSTQSPLSSVEPVRTSTTTSSTGVWTLALVQGISGVLTIEVSPSSASRRVPYPFNIRVPAASSATFADTLVDS